MKKHLVALLVCAVASVLLWLAVLVIRSGEPTPRAHVATPATLPACDMDEGTWTPRDPRTVDCLWRDAGGTWRVARPSTYEGLDNCRLDEFGTPVRGQGVCLWLIPDSGTEYAVDSDGLKG